MPNYRTKSVTIEAVQILPENEAEILEFFTRTDGKEGKSDRITKEENSFVIEWNFTMHTPKESITANSGDWVARGPNNEIIIYKAEEFDSKYDPADS